ncbi:MAG: hypothetical protein EOO75_01570, partial [Myxococcales bacterium]
MATTHVLSLAPRLALTAVLLGPALLNCQDAPSPSITAPPTTERVKAAPPTPPEEAPVVEAPAAGPTTVTAPRVDNVLLITVDALRADQPWTGYQGTSTPHLSRLAAQSVVYERMYSVANTTMPSLSALMMARYPSELSRDDCGLPALWGPDTLAEVVSRQ